MKKLTTAGQGLESFAIYEINKAEKIKGGEDIIILDDVGVG